MNYKLKCCYVYSIRYTRNVTTSILIFLLFKNFDNKLLLHRECIQSFAGRNGVTETMYYHTFLLLPHYYHSFFSFLVTILTPLHITKFLIPHRNFPTNLFRFLFFFFPFFFFQNLSDNGIDDGFL